MAVYNLQYRMPDIEKLDESSNGGVSEFVDSWKLSLEGEKLNDKRESSIEPEGTHAGQE